MRADPIRRWQAFVSLAPSVFPVHFRRNDAQGERSIARMPFAPSWADVTDVTMLCAGAVSRRFPLDFVTKAARVANSESVMTGQMDGWEQLLAAANAGDAQAYARFLRAITPVLRGIVRAKGGGLGTAACEDVVQEVLLAVHLKRHTWAPEAPVRPWLYAITRYKVVDAFRSRGRRVDLPIEDFAEVLAADAGPDPTEAADMDKMIGMLDGRSAEIVRKIGLQGVSVAETGRALTMSEGAVRVALHRALKTLAILRERHVK